MQLKCDDRGYVYFYRFHLHENSCFVIEVLLLLYLDKSSNLNRISNISQQNIDASMPIQAH